MSTETIPPHSYAPPTEQTLRTYMESREVLCGPHSAVIVDGFRFTTAYLNWKEASLAGASHDSTTSTDQMLSSAPKPLTMFRTLFFLSHYHSDHYAGIHSNWNAEALIYSSETTAKLLEHHGLAASRLVGLQMEHRYLFSLRTCSMIDTGSTDGWTYWLKHQSEFDEKDLVNYFTVTLIDANHCPGAVMLLFESCIPPTKGGFGCILHTGDFRYNGDAYVHPRSTASKAAMAKKGSPQKRPRAEPRTCLEHRVLGSQSMCDSVNLQRVAGKVHTLFLDNTFCDPTFKFPPQELVFDAAIRAVRSSLQEQVERVTQQQRVLVMSDEGVQPSVTCQHSCCQPSQESTHADSAAGTTRKKSCVHVAVLVGTYTIGKERVAMAIRSSLYSDRSNNNNKPTGADAAQQFAPPIYISPSKANLLEACSLIRHNEEIIFEELGPPTVSPSQDVSQECFTIPPQVELPLSWDLDQQKQSFAPLNERPIARKLFSQSTGDDRLSQSDHSGGRIRCFVTMYLVPMGAMSYPCLANSVSAVGGAGSGAKGSEEHEVASAVASSAGKHLMLWSGYHLPITMFDRIVCIEPTGWNFKQKQTTASSAPPTTLSIPIPKKVANKYDVYSLPYSEHSSFDELLDFVSFVQPEKIVPTVSLEQFRKQEPLFVERCLRLRSKYANVQPLSRFFPVQKAPFQPASADGGAVGTKATTTTTNSYNDGNGKVEGKPSQPQSVPAPRRCVSSQHKTQGPRDNHQQDKRILSEDVDVVSDDEVQIVAVSHRVFEIDDD